MENRKVKTTIIPYLHFSSTKQGLWHQFSRRILIQSQKMMWVPYSDLLLKKCGEDVLPSMQKNRLSSAVTWNSRHSCCVDIAMCYKKNNKNLRGHGDVPKAPVSYRYIYRAQPCLFLTWLSHDFFPLRIAHGLVLFVNSHIKSHHNSRWRCTRVLEGLLGGRWAKVCRLHVPCYE